MTPPTDYLARRHAEADAALARVSQQHQEMQTITAAIRTEAAKLVEDIPWLAGDE